MTKKPHIRSRYLIYVLAVVLALLPLAVLAADLDTSADLSTDVNVPTELGIGNNSFQISVWATGNLPNARDAVVVSTYYMAANGQITAGTADEERPRFPLLRCITPLAVVVRPHRLDV
jgi:hypothetical protein